VARYLFIEVIIWDILGLRDRLGERVLEFNPPTQLHEKEKKKALNMRSS
jgi:hypothetical protein